MKNVIIGFLIGCFIVICIVYFILIPKGIGLNVGRLVGESVHKQLLGYTKYQDFIAVSEQELVGKTQLLAATVERRENITRNLRKRIAGLRSDAIVEISYTAQYMFGYEFKPGSFKIQNTNTGISIELNKPIILSKPAIFNKTHKVWSSGMLIDEHKSILSLYEGLDKLLDDNAKTLVNEEAVVALCEKKLKQFIADFLKKKDVEKIPYIVVQYKN